MADKCRKGWQLPRSPQADPAHIPNFFVHVFYVTKAQRSCSAGGGSTAHPSHTAPVLELPLGSPGLTPMMVLEEFQILQPLLSYSRKGCGSELWHIRRAAFMRESINDAASASHLSLFPPEVQCSPSACAANDWRCQPRVTAPLPVASRAQPPAGFAFS